MASNKGAELMKAKETLAEKDLIIDALKHQKFSFSQITTKTKENMSTRLKLNDKQQRRLQHVFLDLQKQQVFQCWTKYPQVPIAGTLTECYTCHTRDLCKKLLEATRYVS